MGFVDYLRSKVLSKWSRWSELGTYKATFTPFGTDIFQADAVRACVRALADFTSKAEVKCSDARLQHVLNDRPNMYMNGHDFLRKVRTIYELKNTVFICIVRDDTGKATGFYPVPCRSYEAIEYQGRLYIRFYFTGDAARELVFPWDDLAVLRKDYNESDIAGDSNTAILQMLEVLNTTNQGIANAVKSTANLRGILKSTKAMLAPEDLRKQKETFVKDYMSLENEGGIASLDATQEFEPITMKPAVTSFSTLKEFRENVQRYFGVNDKIIMGNASDDEIEAFYELRVEPFLVALSSELYSKVYTERQRALEKTSLVYEANKLQFASLEKKIMLFSNVVLYGGMTINEWRGGCNMAPVEGGDERIMRLDAGQVGGNNNADKDE